MDPVLKIIDEAPQRRQGIFRSVTLFSNFVLWHALYVSCQADKGAAETGVESKVLLDGLYDPDSPISKLLGVRKEVVGEIIWQKLVENWQIFPGQ